MSTLPVVSGDTAASTANNDNNNSNNNNLVPLLEDNPCWGSPTQCDLEHLLTLIYEDQNKNQDEEYSKRGLILYESDHYIVVNKPPDLRMDGPYSSTVHKLLTYWYPPPSLLANNKNKDKEKETTSTTSHTTSLHFLNLELLEKVSKIHQHNHLEDNALRPCHQLDYATSGVLCIARTQEAAAMATRQWEDRKVQKSYLAIVQGHLKNIDKLLSRLPSEVHVQSTLERLEQSYRKRKRRPRLDTFDGFQPPHAIFHKWKSSLTASNSKNKTSSNYRKKEYKKQKQQQQQKSSSSSFLLTTEDWQQIYKPIEDLVVSLLNQTSEEQEKSSNEKSSSSSLSFPSKKRLQDMHWKEVGRNNPEWKKVFQKAADIHNDLLRHKKFLAENSQEEGSLSSSSLLLPTIFCVDEPEQIGDTGATSTTTMLTLYVYCPIAQLPNDFSMKVPPSILKEYPHMKPFVGDPNLDYKPSLTKCIVLEQGYYDNNGSNTNKDSGNFKEPSLSSSCPVTKVKLWPMTGRRHQLRIHMALLGHAILGDATYDTINKNDNTDATMGTTSTRRFMEAGDGSTRTSTVLRQRPPPRMCLHSHTLSLQLLGEKEKDSSSSSSSSQEEQVPTITSPDPFVIVDGKVQLKVL